MLARARGDLPAGIVWKVSAAMAPSNAKFGLRNAAGVYPSGRHLEAVAAANAAEKVHRAAVALEWLDRLSPGLAQSKPGAAGLAVPVP